MNAVLPERRLVGRPKGKATKTIRIYADTAEALERNAAMLGYESTAVYVDELTKGGLERDNPIVLKMIAVRNKARGNGHGESKD